MAIAIVDKELEEGVVNFWKNLGKRIGKYETRPSLAPGCTDVIFFMEGIAPNEVVLIRIKKIRQKNDLPKRRVNSRMRRSKVNTKHNARHENRYYISTIGRGLGHGRKKERDHYSRINTGKCKLYRQPWKFAPKEYEVPTIKIAVI